MEEMTKKLIRFYYVSESMIQQKKNVLEAN